MNLNLNLKDRMIILNLVLPQFDTRQNMLLKIAVAGKIQLSESERDQVVTNPVGNGNIDIGFKTVEALTVFNDFDFTTEELYYMKARIDYIDQNGMFTVETMDTYNKILEAYDDIDPEVG
ncbi:MAG: hypothetical protein MdMp024_0911 [Bacteroidales bacterium]